MTGQTRAPTPVTGCVRRHRTPVGPIGRFFVASKKDCVLAVVRLCFSLRNARSRTVWLPVGLLPIKRIIVIGLWPGAPGRIRTPRPTA
jgi:hypothetical protein